ncbi:MAG: hypothetical protein D6732_21580 [Methanobacteriota archaeon]|nr:MAG: hypothetical protein D6732_21580 [Euryarchaeota archaeon]
MSYQTRRRQKSPLDHKADLYAAIATIDRLAKHFDRGMVEETLYRRQMKAAISDVFKAQMALEENGFSMEEFINERKLDEKFPEGVKRLNLVQGLEKEEDISLSLQKLKDLPAKSADYVANAIELIDVLRLRSIARVEMIVPLLDEMFNIVKDFPNFGQDHWVAVEIDGWRKALLEESPSKLLSEEDAEQLEFDASRWLNEFRNQIRKIGG